MPTLPRTFSFLREQPVPPLMVRVALDMYGTVEGPHGAENPVILGWADEVAKACGRPYDNWAADYFNSDAIAWCGLFMAVVAVRSAQGRSHRFPPDKYLSALAWSNWGVNVGRDEIEVGDVVVMVRRGGGHVAIAAGVSADGRRFAGLGGNQDNAVNFRVFSTSRINAVRRPPYREKPEGARRVVLDLGGPVSTDER